MAYNNYYGNPYFQQPNYYGNGAVPDMLNQQKMQYQQQPTPPTQMPIISGGLIYVENEEQAKNYLVAPNNIVPMFDKNKPILYVKSSDGAGMPTFKKYTIGEITENAPKTPTNESFNVTDNFVTKDEFNALKGKLEELTQKFNETAVTQVTKINKNAKKGDVE